MKRFITIIFLLIFAVSAVGCGSSAGGSVKVQDQKKEIYEQLNDIAASGTTEMTYYLIAWEFSENTPDIKTLDPQSAVNVIGSRWNTFVKSLSVFGIEVTYDDVIEALTTLYEGVEVERLADKDLLGMLLASEKQYSVDVAKYIYEKYNPLGLSTDYKGDLEKVSSDLSNLSNLKNDEEYALLVDLYEKEVNMYSDIKSAPSGTFEENCKHLDEYREASLRCKEVFSEENQN